MGDQHMGLQARLMSQALRKLTGTVSKSNATVIFINQIRMKIGVMFGNPETTTGGNALKFYSSVRLDVRRIAAHQGRRGGDRQPHAREGREEQGRAAVPAGRVRHPLQRGHLPRGRPARPRRRRRHRREERRLVLVRGRAHRPGPRERAALPEGEPGRPRAPRRGGLRAPRASSAAVPARGPPWPQPPPRAPKRAPDPSRRGWAGAHPPDPALGVPAAAGAPAALKRPPRTRPKRGRCASACATASLAGVGDAAGC